VVALRSLIPRATNGNDARRLEQELLETYLLDPTTDKWPDFVGGRLTRIEAALKQRVPATAS